MVDETKLDTENLVDGVVNPNDEEELDVNEAKPVNEGKPVNEAQSTNEAKPTNEAQSTNEAKPRSEVDEAIALISKGLDDLSPEELAKLYSVLKAHSGELSDAGSAFAQLDAFSAKKLQDFADGKENIAREDIPALEQLNTLVAQNRDPADTTLSKAVNDRIAANNAAFDKNNNLEDVSADAGPMLEANYNAFQRIMVEIDNPLARKEDGTLVNPEMEAFASFFDNIELNSVDEDGAKTKEELQQEALELATLQAETDLALDPEFRKLSDEDKRKKILDSISSRADALALEMLKAQMMMDFKEANADMLGRVDSLTPEEKAELDKKVKEFEASVAQATKNYIERKYPSEKYKLSSTVGTAVVINNGRQHLERTTRVAEKTGFTALKDKALAFDAKMKEKHPKLYPAVKKAMTSATVGFFTGGVGLAALAAVRSGQLIKASYKTYKESGFEGNYAQYLKKNPKEIFSLASSVALTGVSVAFGIDDFAQHGMNAVGVVGKMFSDNVATAATNKLAKASIRAGISVTSGLSTAMIDVRAALNEQDSAKRKQLWKNAAKVAGISIVGGAIGIVSAEYAGDAVNWMKGKLGFGQPDAGVDATSGASVKTVGVASNASDFSKLTGEELDKKLLAYGVNPEVYKDMPDAQRLALLKERVAEFGPLPEDKSAGQASTVTENGNVTEAQLKKMMGHNADRHPGVDMNKIYDQFKAAGIKNPEEAFYKLEQSRLLAPNDKIMTVDGTNIRETMKRALSGEKLTAADLKIVGTSINNVDNTGHYLNDVRSQGGTGSSYRPNGVAQEQENTTASGNNKGVKVGAKDIEEAAKGVGTLDVAKMSPEDKTLYESMMKNFQGKGDKEWQLEANKEYLKYRQLLTDGKADEAAALAKSYQTGTVETQKNEEKNPYQTNQDDGRRLISAKREAAQAEAAYKVSLAKVKTAEMGLKEVKDLPVDDPKRVQAELKHAEAMKDEVKKQMAFSKSEDKLADAQAARDLHHAKEARSEAKDALKLRDKMENRVADIDKKLAKLGLNKNEAPKMTGDYDADKKMASEYLKTAVDNKGNYEDAYKLLKEKQDLNSLMAAQGSKEALAQAQTDAEEKINTVKTANKELKEPTKREFYTKNEEKENGAEATGTRTNTSEQQNVQNNVQNKAGNLKDDFNQSFKDTEAKIEGTADKYATTSLADAAKLKSGQAFVLEDKVGNPQVVGVDKAGHAFKITEVRSGGPGTSITGHVYKIEVGKDHPMYAALHQDNPIGRNDAKESFYKSIRESLKNKEFQNVQAPVSNTMPVNTSGGR